VASRAREKAAVYVVRICTDYASILLVFKDISKDILDIYF
jgi:hypothetical protein